MRYSTMTFLKGLTLTLGLMIAGGIGGGIIGRAFNKKIDEGTVDKMLIGSLVVIIALCAMNVVKYMF